MLENFHIKEQGYFDFSNSPEFIILQLDLFQIYIFFRVFSLSLNSFLDSRFNLQLDSNLT